MAQFGAQSAVHAEDPVLNDGGHRHAVEEVRESPPELDGVAALALVVEA